MSVTSTNLDRLSPLRRARLTGEVLATYIRVRWLMRGDDAEGAVVALRESAAVASPSPPLSEDERLVAAWRLARATQRVLGLLPTDSRCLFRSLTLMCMLERRGVPQVVVIAVRPQPFAAHAWVEVAKTAILEVADPGYERLLEL
jgi:hypothetical protein